MGEEGKKCKIETLLAVENYSTSDDIYGNFLFLTPPQNFF
jgi:hypothetical protein